MAQIASTTSMPQANIKGVHHLKLPAKSIRRTMDFYTKVLSFKHLSQLDHLTPDRKLYAVILIHEPTKLLLEVRHNAAQAEAQKGWDPITWAVGTRKDLEKWEALLDLNKVKRSPIFTSLNSWIMGCEDPDRKIVRFFVTDEEHEWTEDTSTDPYWLGVPEGDPET